MGIGKNVVALVPSVSGTEHVLGALFGVINQSVPPLRVVVGDCSKDGLEKTFAVKRFCRVARIDVLRLSYGTNAHDTRKALVESVPVPDFVWFVDEDVWPTYRCLSKLLKTAEKYDAKAVVGTKYEVTRKNVFGGKDWNQAGDSIREQSVCWCDTANLLIHGQEVWDCINSAEKFSGKERFQTGEDVLATAKLASTFVCISQPSAIAYHIPMTPERWINLDETDSYVMSCLGPKLWKPHMEWMKRSLEQSGW